MDRFNEQYILAHLRRHLPFQICDETDGERAGIAIYGLSDPSDIRHVRYVGQTGAPPRRYCQHVRASLLSLDTDAERWWVVAPRLRRPCRWIRELYDEHRRLPLMVVREWVPTLAAAREAELNFIHDCLGQGMTLLNREASVDAPQLSLL